MRPNPKSQTYPVQALRRIGPPMRRLLFGYTLVLKGMTHGQFNIRTKHTRTKHTRTNNTRRRQRQHGTI